MFCILLRNLDCVLTHEVLSSINTYSALYTEMSCVLNICIKCGYIITYNSLVIILIHVCICVFSLKIQLQYYNKAMRKHFFKFSHNSLHSNTCIYPTTQSCVIRCDDVSSHNILDFILQIL